MSRLSSISRAWVIPLLLGAASACEAIVGLGAYSEGASRDAAVDAARPHDGARKVDAPIDARVSHADAGSDAPPVQKVECDAASNCKGATCSVATCNQGACVYTTPTGSSCDGGVCNEAGACVECLSATECPPSTSACEEPSCSKTGACQFSPKPASAKCDGGLCDGNGNCSSCSACTPRACYTTSCPTGSGCQFNAAPRGTTCDAGGAGVCNGSGACVVCNTVADCTIPSRESCQIATCNATECVDLPAMVGTVCSMSPTMYCNGSEHCVECTPKNTGACTGGTPYCSDAGACVQCTAGTQCPGIGLGCNMNECVTLVGH
jgi:hypothetical protein